MNVREAIGEILKSNLHFRLCNKVAKACLIALDAIPACLCGDVEFCITCQADEEINRIFNE